MSSYVEQGYSNGYVEGDTPSSSPTNCDLSQVISMIESQNTQIEAIKTSIAELATAVSDTYDKANSNNQLSLSINNNVVNNKNKLLEIQNAIPDISNLPTMDYINTKIPFVDDMSVKVFPNGTTVEVGGFDGLCEIVSSSLLPHEEFTYFVIYVVAYDFNGITKLSNFPAHQVSKYIPPAVV